MDDLFTLFIVVGGNVLSHFIIQWLDNLFDNGGKNDKRQRLMASE